MFELRRDPITGWWSAVVTDRTFEHSSFAVQAAAVEGSHCRHCDDDPTDAADAADETTVRRVTLRSDAFLLPEEGKDRTQLSLLTPGRASGAWEILVAPREHHERLAEAPPRLAVNLLRTLRDRMRELATERAEDQALYVQAVQSYGRQAGSRTQHLNIELYAIPQVPHRVAEEIGGGARYLIKAQRCVWCSLIAEEEESGERLVLAEDRFVVFAPAASRSAFELMIVPRAHAADFASLDDDAIAATTATLQRTLGALEALGDPPYNLFLHTAPAGERLDAAYHWHWEVHPRLRVIAGLERATALAVNPAAPEFAADVLRSHLSSIGSPGALAGAAAELPARAPVGS